MEQMPYQPHQTEGLYKVFPPAASLAETDAVTSSNWQDALPVLQGRTVTLRQLRRSDAVALHALLTTEEVARFISPPPATVEEFERFIDWTHRKRQDGTYACFAVVPEGMDTAIGIFQIRSLQPGFGTAEWGFALGSPYWGRGYFQDGAELLIDFAFDTIGVRRLEARSSVENLRGNGALRKMGAAKEAVLRQSFLKNERYHDQALWVLLASDRASEVA
jgi:ribosomal-protein-alanine N-acetyltransferase